MFGGLVRCPGPRQSLCHIRHPFIFSSISGSSSIGAPQLDRERNLSRFFASVAELILRRLSVPVTGELLVGRETVESPFRQEFRSCRAALPWIGRVTGLPRFTRPEALARFATSRLTSTDAQWKVIEPAWPTCKGGRRDCHCRRGSRTRSSACSTTAPDSRSTSGFPATCEHRPKWPGTFPGNASERPSTGPANRSAPCGGTRARAPPRPLRGRPPEHSTVDDW